MNKLEILTKIIEHPSFSEVKLTEEVFNGLLYLFSGDVKINGEKPFIKSTIDNTYDPDKVFCDKDGIPYNTTDKEYIKAKEAYDKDATFNGAYEILKNSGFKDTGETTKDGCYLFTLNGFTVTTYKLDGQLMIKCYSGENDKTFQFCNIKIFTKDMLNRWMRQYPEVTHRDRVIKELKEIGFKVLFNTYKQTILEYDGGIVYVYMHEIVIDSKVMTLSDFNAKEWFEGLNTKVETKPTNYTAFESIVKDYGFEIKGSQGVVPKYMFNDNEIYAMTLNGEQTVCFNQNVNLTTEIKQIDLKDFTWQTLINWMK